MTKIFKFKDYDQWFTFDYKNRTLVAEVDMDLSIYDVLILNNETYVVFVEDLECKEVYVRQLDKFVINPDESLDDNFICPYCGDIDYDAWDKEEGETICNECGSDLEFDITMDGMYHVVPIKPTKIINI